MKKFVFAVVLLALASGCTYVNSDGTNTCLGDIIDAGAEAGKPGYIYLQKKYNTEGYRRKVGPVKVKITDPVEIKMAK